MADNSNVNPQIVKSIRQVQEATMTPGVTQANTSGKAYQSIAQSSAMAVQDATDNLRNLRTVTNTVIGTVMAQILAGKGQAQNNPVISKANAVMSTATQQWCQIGQDAGKLLTEFQVG